VAIARCCGIQMMVQADVKSGTGLTNHNMQCFQEFKPIIFPILDRLLPLVSADTFPCYLLANIVYSS
jgi:hypothetical protein